LLTSATAAPAVAASPPKTVVTQTGSSQRDVLDGTRPFTVTPHRDGTVTVSQDGAGDITFSATTLKVSYSGTWPADPPPPTCGVAPPNETRHNTCPAGTHGAGWDQTRTWTSAAYPTCWVESDWQPATMPAGACVPDGDDSPPPPPPTGDGTLNFDLSHVDSSSPAFSDFVSFANRLDEPTAMDLFYAYKLTGNTSYRDRAVRLVDDYVTATLADINAGFTPDIAGDSYLYADDPITEIAFATAWGNPTSAQSARWAQLANQTIYNIWHPRDARWGGRLTPWSGWAIDDPNNNYHIHFLHLTTAWAIASQDQALLADLRAAKWPAMVSAMQSIAGGGDLEGTGYGYAQKILFDTYKLAHDSGYSDLDGGAEHMANTIRWWVYGTMPTLDRFMPIGDQPRVSVPWIYDYQRSLVETASFMTGDADAKAVGSWWLTHIQLQHDDVYRANYAEDLYPYATSAPQPPALTFRAEETGLMTARSSWSDDATFIGVIAGEFSESHAHREQGGFTFFKRDWLAVTNNMWSRSAIRQESIDKNTVRFERNGTVKEQDYGAADVTAYTANPATGELHTTMDMTPLYQVGDNKGVQHWDRVLDYDGRNDVVVTDHVVVASGTTATFQLNVPVRPTISGNTITAGGLTATVVEPQNAAISVVDMTTVDPSDYQSGWRVDVKFGSTAKVKLHAN
jgi:hypothetical protein